MVLVLLCSAVVGAVGESATSARPGPPASTWVRLDSPPSAHGAGHSATRLRDGSVLVVGGGVAVPAATADLYDPVRGVWRTTGAMATARAGHTATLLADGRVLVVGGSGGSDRLAAGGYERSAEVYDPAARVWGPAGSLPVGRIRHTATLLGDGRVLVAGGMTLGPIGFPVLDSCYLYDPATGSWSQTGSMTIGRYAHTATLLADGRVLVAGGADGEVSPSLATAETFDPATGRWTVVPHLMTAPRARHTATLLADGTVLLVAGTSLVSGPGRVKGSILASAEVYEPLEGTWRPVPALSGPRLAHFAVPLPDGTVLVAGGLGGPAGTVPIPNAQRFQPSQDRWSAPFKMTVAPTESATLLSGPACDDRCANVLFLAGDQHDLASLYRYHPARRPRRAKPGRRWEGEAAVLAAAAAGLALVAVQRLRRAPRT